MHVCVDCLLAVGRQELVHELAQGRVLVPSQPCSPLSTQQHVVFVDSPLKPFSAMLFALGECVHACSSKSHHLSLFILFLLFLILSISSYPSSLPLIPLLSLLLLTGPYRSKERYGLSRRLMRLVEHKYCISLSLSLALCLSSPPSMLLCHWLFRRYSLFIQFSRLFSTLHLLSLFHLFPICCFYRLLACCLFIHSIIRMLVHSEHTELSMTRGAEIQFHFFYYY